MLGRLLLLFIIVPVIELFLLIEIGRLIGTLPTIGIIILTGMIGAFLTRLQGLATLNRIRTELQQGKLPGESLIDGVIILVAGAFLMTPGVFTDVLGFACLIPATRNLFKRAIWGRIQQAIKDGRIITHTNFQTDAFSHMASPPPHQEPPEIIIIDPEEKKQ